jgi:spore coat protein U-like protein
LLVSTIRGLLVAMACVVALWIGGAPARAQTCTYTTTPMNYGVVSLVSGAAVDTTATLTATCSGTANRVVMICPSLGDGTGGGSNGNRTLLSGTNTLAHNLYSDAARSTIWGSSVWPYTPRPPKLTVTLNGSGTGTGSWTIYGRILSGQQAKPTGTYTSTFGPGHVLFKVRYNDTSTCASAIGTDSAVQPSFVTSITVQTSCAVSATDLDFGSRGVLSSAVQASSNVSINCSLTTPYTVSLGVVAGETSTTRTLSKGSESVRYGTYKDTGRTQPWGSTTGQTVAGTGSGLAQTIPVYGQVSPQATPSAGNYTDTVVVTVTY